MESRRGMLDRVPLFFWILAVTAIAIWSQYPGYVVGWDLNVYRLAMLSTLAGHDPYLACVAARRIYFDHLAFYPNASQPFGYIYPPITLPLLRFLATRSIFVVGVSYWLIYLLSITAVLWISAFAVRKREWPVFTFIAPIAIFFPGLLFADPLFSGNIGYIFTGLVFAGAFVGWRKGRWIWFYMAVLIASLVKPTFFTLLPIPILTARRQWIPALGTATFGLCCTALEVLLWPSQFSSYKISLHSQLIAYIHDFGFHPAGILADALYTKLPYQLTFGLIYALCATIFGGILVHLRERFLRDEFPLKEWIPVALIGVTLLNPRIMQYDLLPVTLPMAVVGWRFLQHWFQKRYQTILAVVTFFIITNLAGSFAWNRTECLLLVLAFLAGSWTLLQYSLVGSRTQSGILHSVLRGATPIAPIPVALQIDARRRPRRRPSCIAKNAA